MSADTPTPREQAAVAGVAAQMSANDEILRDLRGHIEVANQLMVVLHERGLMTSINYVPFFTIAEAEKAKGVPLHAIVRTDRAARDVTPPLLHAISVPMR